MTISTCDQSVDIKKFNESFEKIFGKREGKTGKYVLDPETGKYVPCETMSRESASVNAPMVMKPLQEFVSPIDRQVISNRAQLAAHNKKHGVTNASDYKDGYVEKQAYKRVAAGEKYLKDTRRTDIGDAIDQFTR
jgi:hypothetical protein